MSEHAIYETPNVKPSIATVVQPKPTGNGTAIIDLLLNEGLPPLLMNDLRERSELGLRKYQTYLRINNGRNALIDLYQELLDAVYYSRQILEERGDAYRALFTNLIWTTENVRLLLEKS